MVAHKVAGMVAHKVAGMVVRIGGRKKKINEKHQRQKKLADMLLHMVADKVAGMVADIGAEKKWLTWSWTWWPTRR